MELMRVLGEFAIAAGFIAWLVKSLVSALLSKDLETHKASLQSQTQAEVERLKFELTLVAQRQATEFSALHAKRAELVSELYPLLMALEHAVGILSIRLDYVAARALESAKAADEATDRVEAPVATLLGEYEKELVVTVEDAYMRFVEAFKPSRIYLPERLCASITRGTGLAARFSIDFERHVASFDRLKADDLMALAGSLNSLASGWQTSLRLFEDEFRTLMGVRDSEATTPAASQP